MGSEPGGATPERASFVQSLEALKRQGSNVLVVGTTAVKPHDAVCGRLMGTGSVDSRSRIVVTTDWSRVVSADCCGPEATQFLVLGDGDRAEEEIPDNATEVSLLGVLGTTFVELINDIEADMDLDPSQLRVCVDSVSDLVEMYDTENVFRLLHAMTTRIRQSRGMGHYHLPIDRAEEAVSLYEPLFDAVITLRTNGERIEHRWDLRDGTAQTDWIDL
ncbi:DUF7504 family protein [Halovivax gelatinilyticus]|uniref:DUF7504 family protein n=1 Tax=Halovivax gelatinilyticus TaxID=2961597 RepID=UPI0020CA27C0|nr:hypothetical protein [Halovivax gelatinilyticus]